VGRYKDIDAVARGRRERALLIQGGHTRFIKERGIMLTRSAKAGSNAKRHSDLKTILERRRSELMHDVQHKIRDVRSDGITERDVLDEAESSEVYTQDDIEFALIQLKAETLNKIDAALRRIEEGNYGDCSECGGEIAEARLRALPFAVRCRDCEDVREATDQRQRSLAQRGVPSTLFFDLRS
jgi:DnaK suppressor protein